MKRLISQIACNKYTIRIGSKKVQEIIQWIFLTQPKYQTRQKKEITHDVNKIKQLAREMTPLLGKS